MRALGCCDRVALWTGDISIWQQQGVNSVNGQVLLRGCVTNCVNSTRKQTTTYDLTDQAQSSWSWQPEINTLTRAYTNTPTRHQNILAKHQDPNITSSFILWLASKKLQKGGEASAFWFEERQAGGPGVFGQGPAQETLLKHFLMRTSLQHVVQKRGQRSNGTDLSLCMSLWGMREMRLPVAQWAAFVLERLWIKGGIWM